MFLGLRRLVLRRFPADKKVLAGVDTIELPNEQRTVWKNIFNGINLRTNFFHPLRRQFVLGRFLEGS